MFSFLIFKELGRKCSSKTSFTEKQEIRTKELGKKHNKIITENKKNIAVTTATASKTTIIA